jgi:hypothetical protein
MHPFKSSPLAVLLLAGGAIYCAQARSAAADNNAMALAQAAGLPSCISANYDNQRALFTILNNPVRLSPRTGEAVDTKGAVLPVAQQPVNQQCILTVAPRGRAQGGELAAGRYTVYYSNGGDGGAGGTQRYNGGGGGGAGAVQQRTIVDLAPGTYKLTLGLGGPGGVACNDPLPGGPGYPGSPTGLISLANGVAVAGTPGADSWKRPTRRELERMRGNLDGHGGSGPGKAAGGNGGVNTAGRAYGASDGAQSAAAWVDSRPGDNGTGQSPQRFSGIGAGGGGGAGLGNGGDGGDSGPEAKARAPELLAVSGGLGAGGGGGQGDTAGCTAGAPGGAGYMAFRPVDGGTTVSAR